jgi:hypothetical protein
MKYRIIKDSNNYYYVQKRIMFFWWTVEITLVIETALWVLDNLTSNGTTYLTIKEK